MTAAKSVEPRICIWCTINEIEHGFDIPLCVPCLVKVHFMTSKSGFDANKEVQDYIKAKIPQTAAPDPTPPHTSKKH